jgi:biopolymer transport protein ExbB
MKKLLILALSAALFAEDVSIPPPIVETQEISAAAPSIVEDLEMDAEDDIAAIHKEEMEVAAAIKPEGIIIDLGQVFSGSPTIYAVLCTLSIASLAIWAYLLLQLRTAQLVPAMQCQEIREKLLSKNYDEALNLCENHPSILLQMIATGIQSRKEPLATRQEMMKAEGLKASNSLWQKMGLLNDIAVIAPMLGLLGTVLGMFYAFYDLNRSMESISSLFDGLGISVGTTVGGLIVAILAMVFHAVIKYRLVRQLTCVENEAKALATLIDTQGSV